MVYSLFCHLNPVVKLRIQILLFLLIFALTPLIIAVMINLPLVLDRTALFYQKAYLQNLRADFRDLDQHLASRHEMIRLFAKLPEPGFILGDQGDDDQIDVARARYTAWINQILADQLDIIQILFIGSDGQERFWLTRDAATQQWHPSAVSPELPNPQFLDAAMQMQESGILVSRIRINAEAGAKDPQHLLNLNLASAIGVGASGEPQGVLVMSIDVGGLAEFYRDTLWVNNDGAYLRPGLPISRQPEAFTDFAGLSEIFAQGQLALWKDDNGRQMLWVPMFVTEDAVPLWVARPVDPSPLESFRNALIFRVLSIVLMLVGVVMILARWIAARAELFGHELTGSIGRILTEGKAIRLEWNGPLEVRELGHQLTALSENHAEHLRAAQAHTKELERSYRYKSEFLANVSHELRTPLNSILLLSKMLADRQSGLNAEQLRQAEVIHEAGADLRTMIDNILDISRIEAGQVTITLEWIELRPLVSELMELISPLFDEKGLDFRFEMGSDVPERLYTDREKLRQILKNFLANAAKFTEKGEVTIQAERLASESHPLALSVVDTGIGIPDDKQEVIFDAFQQADGSTRRRYGGTGLGLSISRELAGLLGGYIEVESVEGQGSRFTLFLPVELNPQALDTQRVIHAPVAEPRYVAEEEAPQVLVATSAIPRAAGHWILVIERDVQSLVALTTRAEALGLGVQTAVDAEEALETLLEEADCALVLLAARISVQDTCDMIDKIHAEARFGELPIIVLETTPDRDLHEACQQAGAYGFLTKPIDPTDFGAMLDRLL